MSSDKGWQVRDAYVEPFIVKVSLSALVNLTAHD